MQETDSLDVRLFGDAVRRILDAHRGTDPLPAWRKLCAAGLGAIGAAAEDARFLSIAAVETGRANAVVPLLGAAAANLLLAGRPEARDFLADVASGSAVVALAAGALDGDGSAGRAVAGQGEARGTLGAIEGWPHATHLLVLLGEGESCGLVPADDPGVAAALTEGLADPPLARLELNGSRIRQFALDPVMAARAVDLMRLLASSRAFGAQQRAFELALDHARTREQFGQPIGRFQAIQHKLADCRVRSDAARLLIGQAIGAMEDGGDVERAVATLVSVSASALRRNVYEILHVFGAVGYALEHEASRLFLRVQADTMRFGGAGRARAVLAARMLAVDTDDGIVPIPPEPEALRTRRAGFRAFVSRHWTETDRAGPARHADADPRFIAALADAGWIAANWPEEHGGPGFDAFEQFAYIEEMRAAGAPVTLLSPSAWIVGPAIIAFGTNDMKRRFLPGIARGTTTFCLGYSEPQAGSDLAALTTRATRDGGHYVISGQKIWTSLADSATHIFLAARTGENPERRHEGISVFIVPIDTPGIARHMMETVQGKSFASVFYDDVRLPADMRLGEEGEGWTIITSALAAERIVMGGQVASLRGLLAALVAQVRTRPGFASDPVRQHRLAELIAEVEAARALALESVRIVHGGGLAAVEGAITKLYSGDLAERMAEALLDMFGVEASLGEGAEGALLDGAVSRSLRTAPMLVIGGGTAEIQRNLIAQRGLGLPRPGQSGRVR